MMSDDYKLLGQKTGAKIEHKVGKKKYTVSELGVVLKSVGTKGYSVKQTIVLGEDNEIVKYEDFYTLKDSITTEHLVDLCEEPSYRMPQGLSREERKEWVEMIASKDNTTYLSNDAWNKLQEVLDNPPQPNEAMKELREEFKND